MANEIGSFVVNIKAQIEGYQEQINAIKAKLAEVGKDTNIGKEIAKSLKLAESQVERLGKTMDKRISSESQITALTDNLQNISRLIMDIGDSFGKVTWDDLNVDGLRENIQSAKTEIDNLTNSMQENVSKGFAEALASSAEMRDVFKSLKIDPAQMGVDEVTEKLRLSLIQATSTLENYKAELDKITLKAEEAAQKMSNIEIDKSKIENAKNSLSSVFDNLKLITTQTRTVDIYKSDDFFKAIEEKCNSLYDTVNDKGKGIIDKIREIVSWDAVGEKDPNKLYGYLQEINNLFKDLNGRSLSGNITGFGNRINEIFENLTVKNIETSITGLDKFRAALENLFANNNNFGMDSADAKSFIDKILNVEATKESIDAAEKEVANAIKNYLTKVSKDYKEASQEAGALSNERKTAQQKYDDAKANSAAIKTAETKYLAEIKLLKDKNAELQTQLDNAVKRLEALEKESESRKNGKSPMGDFGRKQKQTAAQSLNDAANAAGKYNAQLEQVKAREQAIGNIQSFVQRWFSVYAAARLVSNAFKSMKTNLKDLDDIMTQISIVTDKTQGDLWKQMPQYTDMAKQYASSIKGVYEVSQLYYQQGLGQNDVMALTEQTLKMAKISGLDYATATDYMTNAIRSFKMEMTDAQQVVDVYSAIAASSATNTAELATAMSKTASSAQSVGSSFESTSAMMAVMIEATRESAENIGSAMKSIISRYGEMTKNPNKLIDSEGEAMSLNKVDTALQSVGISIHDAQGQFRDFDDVISELSKNWDKIDKNTQRYIATIMAGNRQQSRFLALVSNGERLEELTEKAANAEDTATLQVLKTMDSISAKAQQLQTSLQSLYTEGGFENLYKNILDLSKNIVDTFTGMPKLFGNIPVTAIAMFSQLFVNIGGLVTQGLERLKQHYSSIKDNLSKNTDEGVRRGVESSQSHINSLVAKFAAASQQIKTYLSNAISSGVGSANTQNPVTENSGVQYRKFTKEEIDSFKKSQAVAAEKWNLMYDRGTLTKDTENQLKRLNRANLTPPTAKPSENPNSEESKPEDSTSDSSKIEQRIALWNQYKSTVSTAARTIGAGLQVAAMAMDKTTNHGKTLAATLSAVGGSLSAIGYAAMGSWPMAIITGLTTAIKAFDDFNISTEEKIKKIGDNITSTENTKLQSKDDLKTLIDYKNKYDELRATRNADADSRKKWQDLNNEIASKYPELISSMNAEGNAIVDMTSSYQQLLKVKQDVYKDDFQKNLVAELAGLSDLDYVLSKNYATQPLNNNNKLTSFFTPSKSDLFSNKNNYNLDKIGDAFAESLKNDTIDFSKSFSLTFADANKIFDGSLKQDIHYTKFYSGLLGEYTDYNLNADTAEELQNVIADMADLAIQGFSKQAAAEQLINSGKYSENLNTVITKFDSTLYNYFQASSNAISFSQKLMDKRLANAGKEWLNILQQVTELDVNDIQNFALGEQLQQEWENYKENYAKLAEAGEEGYHKINVFKKEDGTTWTIGDIYNQFLESKEVEWYKSVLESLDYLANNSIEEIFKNLGTMPRSKIEKLDLSKYGDKAEEIRKILLESFDEQYETSIEDFQKGMQDSLKNAHITSDFATDKIKDLFGPEFLDSIAEKYYEILDNGNLSIQEKVAQVTELNQIYKKIASLDEDNQETILSKMSTADLTSLSGIYTLIDELESQGIDLDANGLRKELLDLGKTLTANLTTEFASFSQSVADKAEDFNKILSKASKGMDLKEAMEAAEKMNVSISDFDFKDGKFFFDNANKIYEAYVKYNTDLETALNDEVINLQTAIDNYDLDNIFGTVSDLLESGKIDASHIEKAFAEAGVDEAAIPQLVEIYQSYYEAAQAAGKDVEDYINEQIAQGQEELIVIRNALEYQKNVTLIQSGNIDKFLDNLGIYGQDKKDVAKQITSGNIEKALLEHPELADYTKVLIETYKSINTNINSSLTSSIKDGAQFIKKTDYLNADKFKSLGNLATEVKNTNGEIIGYYVEVTKENVNEYIKWVKDNAKNLTQSDIKSSLKEAHDLQFPNVASALQGITSDSVSYDTMQNFVEAIGENAENIDEVAKQYGFTVDTVTGNFIRGNSTLAALQNKLAELQAEGTDIKAINAVAAQIDTLKNQSQRNALEAAKTILSKQTEVTEDNIRNFADSLGIAYDEMKAAFTMQSNGYYKADMGAIASKMAEAGVAIDSFIAQLFDSAIAAIQGNASIMTSGFSNVESTMTDFTELRDLTGEDLKFTDIYRLDPILHKYVYTTEGLIVANNARSEAIAKQYEDAITGLENSQMDISDEGFSKFLENNSGQFKDYYQAWNAYIAEQKAIAQQSKEAADALTGELDNIEFEKIDFSGIADGTISFAKAQNQLISYITAANPEEKDQDKIKEMAEQLYNQLASGGEEAIEAYYKNGGKDQKVAQALYEGNNAAQEILDAIKGKADNATIVLTDAWKKVLGVDKDKNTITAGEIKAPEMLAKLFEAIGIKVSEGKQSIEDYNADVMQVINESESSKTKASTEALSSAISDFNASTLEALVNSLGIQLKQGIDIEKAAGTTEGANGKKIISNVEEFLNWVINNADGETAKFLQEHKEAIESGITISSQISARSSVVQANITELTAVEKELDTEISNLISAKIGDYVDISTLLVQYTEKSGGDAEAAKSRLAADLGVASEDIENGYLQISSKISSGVWGIISNLFNRNFLPESVETNTQELQASAIQSAISAASSFQNGSIIDAETVKVLQNAGAQLNVLDNGTAVINSAQEYINAVKLIYDVAKKSFEQNTTDLTTLNNSFANLIKANNSQDSAVNSMLSSAANLSVDTLNNFATGIGRELEDFIDESGKPLLDSIKRVGIDSYQVTNWQDYITELQNKLGISIDNTTQDYINAYISWLESEANTAPNPKEALMTSLIPNLEKLSYAEIGQIAKTFEMTVEQVLALVENNGDNTFNAKDLLNVLPIDKTNEEFARALSTQLQSVTSNMTSAMVAFVEAGADGKRTNLDISNLKNAISDFEKGMQALGQSVSVQNIGLALVQGGEVAVAAAEQIAALSGQELSASDVATLYQGQVSKLVNAVNTVVAQPGEIVDAITASIIGQSGGQVSQLGTTGQYVVESVANLYEAYNNLLQKMVATGEATLADLNKVAALALENRKTGNSTASEQYIIDALGDAANMTYTRFGEILASAGYRLSETLVKDWSEAGIIKDFGGSKMAITDFSKFADVMGWEAGSEEYTSAFKTYNDSLINMNRQAEKNILEEVSKVGEAKGGDWINLTQIMDKMRKGFATLADNSDAPSFEVISQALSASLAQYNAKIENGILKLDEDANIPMVFQTIADNVINYGELSANETAQLLDTIKSVLENYANLISSGIDGTLSNSGAEQLKQFASGFGIKDLTFSETTKGLKVSTEQAYKLYQAIKKIDALQGNIVFDKLAESLRADKGGDFSSASKTMAAVARVEQQIEKNQQKVNEAREKGMGLSFQEWQLLEKQNTKLKEKKTLYEDIQKEMAFSNMDNPDSFNFMNQDLPKAMQGPINYWDSVGKAFAAMNESKTTGKMAIQDFYNIITEMNNLIALTGNELVLAGVTLDGSAESAAALIRKGMSSLTNIDGKGVKVNLQNLSIDFVSGAEGAKNNFHSGVQALAKSQVEMLDAAIKVLEIVVAMENLGNIDVDGNNVFSIGDIFKLDAEGNPLPEYTKEYQAFAEDLLKQAKTNEDINEALEAVKINGITMKELLQDAADGMRNVNLSEQEYFAVMDAFVKAAQSGDWDLDNIFESVKDIINSSFPDGMTVDVGDKTFVISGGTVGVIDWNDSGTQEAIKIFEGKVENSKQAVIDSVTKYQNNTGGQVDVIVGLAVNGEIDINVDEKGNITVKDPNGKEFDPNSNIGAYLIAEAAMKAKGIEPPFSWSWTEENGGQAKTTIKVGTEERVVFTDSKGNVWYHSDRTGQDYSSKQALIDAEVEQLRQQLEEDGDYVTYGEAYEILYHEEYKFKANIKSDLNDGEIAQKAREIVKEGSDKIKDKIKEAGEAEEGDNYTYTISEDGKTITFDLNGVQVEVANTGNPQKDLEAAISTLGDGLEYTDLITKIETGINNAFSGDTVKQSITGAIQSALGISGSDSSGSGIPIPQVKLLPSGITIDISQAGQPTLSNTNGTRDLQMDEVTLKPTNVKLDLTGYTPTTEGENVSNENVPIGTVTLQPGKVSLDLTGYTPTAEDVPEEIPSNAVTVKPNSITIDTSKEPEEIPSLEANVSTVNATPSAAPTIKTEGLQPSTISTLEATVTTVNATAETVDASGAATSIADDIRAKLESEEFKIKIGLELNTGEQKSETGGEGKSDTSSLSNLASAFESIGSAGSEAVGKITQALNEVKADNVKAIQDEQDKIQVDKVTAIQDEQDKITTDKVKAIQDEQDKITTNKVEAIQNAQNAIRNDKVMAIQQAQSGIKHDKVDAIQAAQSGIKHDKIEAVRDAISKIKAPTSLSTSMKLSVDAKGNMPGVAKSKGSNMAMASGTRKTLMGELGPELVVSNGRYFIAGANGAEFVDLASDAIVFNHLQTRRLFEQGAIGGRGHALTNEREAVAYAKGKIPLTGPAHGQKGDKDEDKEREGQQKAAEEAAKNPTKYNKNVKIEKKKRSGTINWYKGTFNSALTSNGSITKKMEFDVEPGKTKTLKASGRPNYWGANFKDGSKGNGSGSWLKKLGTYKHTNTSASAKGNIPSIGPAKASASEALDLLKQLRAMWQSLAEASLKDMGGGAGGGGGGGGGGSGKNDKNNDDYVAGVVAEVERWYNWLKAIEKIQENINKLTKEYNIMEKEGISTQQRLKNLDEQRLQVTEDKAIRAKLVDEQTRYRESLYKQIRDKKSAASAFYRVGSNGEILLASDASFQNFVNARTKKTKKKNFWQNYSAITQHSLNKNEAKALNKANAAWNAAHKDDKNFEERKTDYAAGEVFEGKLNAEQVTALKKLDKTKYKKLSAGKTWTDIEKMNINSGLELMKRLQEKDEYGNLKLSAAQQYKMLSDLGFKEFMERDSAGNRLDKEQEGWQATAVQNFYDKVEGMKEEVESLSDSITEQEQAILDDYAAIADINDQIRELLAPVTGVTEGFTKWYNETQKIKTAQAEINKLTKELSNLQNDFIANGFKIFKNYKDQEDSLNRQNKINEELLKKRENLAGTLTNKYSGLIDKGVISIDENGTATFSDSKVNNGKIQTSYQQIATNDQGYQIDEEGKYIDDKGVLRDKEGKEITDKNAHLGVLKYDEFSGKSYDTTGKTFEQIIEDITSQDASGNVAYNAEEQYQILKSLGLEDFMKYDEKGNKIYDDFGELSKEDMQKAVEAGIKRIQGSVNEINENNDEIINLQQEQLEIQSQLQSIQKALIDNQIEVQDLVKDAIVQQHQDAIDNKKKFSEAIEDAANKTITGMRKSLDKEKDIYSENQDKKELSLLRMQLSTAEMSGSSLSKIRDLQTQIQNKQQEMYFNEREKMIDELEEQTNETVEALNDQIELAQTSLDYQVKYGEIWQEVNEKMSELSPSQLAALITNNMPEYESSSPDARVQTLNSILEKLQLFESNIEYENLGKVMEELLSTTYSSNAGNFTKEQKDKIEEAGRKAFLETDGSLEEKKRAAKEAMNKKAGGYNTAFELNKKIEGLDTNSKTFKSEAESIKAKYNSLDSEYKNLIKIDDLNKKEADYDKKNKPTTTGGGNNEGSGGSSGGGSDGSSGGGSGDKKEEPDPDTWGGAGAVPKYTKKQLDKKWNEIINIQYSKKHPEGIARPYQIIKLIDPKYGGPALYKHFTAFMTKNYTGDIDEDARAYGKRLYPHTPALDDSRPRFKGEIPPYNTLRTIVYLYTGNEEVKDVKKWPLQIETLGKGHTKKYKDKISKILYSKKYKKGGDIDFTGPAWVDGTKNKPEHIFNFEQMESLRAHLLSGVDTTSRAVAGLSNIINNLPDTNTYNNITNDNSGISINNLEFHMEVKEISNDYDARRAGQEALSEMVRIAYKAGNRSIFRR